MRLHSVEVDLMDRAVTAAAAAELMRFEVTTPVHNAGVIRPALVADVKLDDLDALVVARAVSFFASRDAGFVTGQVLYVCGGTSVGSLTL